ncbi:hypothetical protein GQ43DRAFT_436754 [Delitschia confertaspora ATCC 74209]|uniref:Uncharacterized protein n=1 Tax=Delitschia confertaspora ATCC 74209 TaxID=1513339 RepID=A0A9P4JWP1_9PLEO|nr:hypothetical protein GQ43DRAFT_436754 [Delitschia confertaspora ATCC 74209]
MASRRALLSLAVPLRASASSLLRPQFVKQSVQAVAPISARINGLKASGPVEVQRRGHAGFPSEKKSKVWEYDDVSCDISL